MKLGVAPVAFAALVPSTFAFAMDSGHITTRGELNAAAQTCANDLQCLHDVLNRAFPLTPELERSTLGYFFSEYVILSIRASQQLHAAEATELLTVSLKNIEGSVTSRKIACSLSAPLHIYRAERCQELGLDDCFLESAAGLMQREIAMRAANTLRRAQHSEPYKWSEIKIIPDQSPQFDGKRRFEMTFVDMGDLLERLHPDGTDYEARLDRILTLAEWMKN